MNREKKSRRRVKNNKIIGLLASLAVLFTVGVFGTVAYLTTSTAPVVNTFTPGTVEPSIDEDIENGVKNNVIIENEGNVPVYVRAMVLVSWLDDNRNVHATAPVMGDEKDYIMTLPATDGWVLSGGYYYYNSAVPAKGKTTKLLTDGQLLDTAEIPEGYELSIEIFAQTIQAEPAQAVKEAWGDTAAQLVGATN